MPSYRAPVEDIIYALKDVWQIERYSNIPGFAEASPDMIRMVLEEGGKIAEEVLFPIRQSGDEEGCVRHEDGSVTTPKGFKQAYDTFTKGGWQGLTASAEYGGQELPAFLGFAVSELMLAANHAFEMYPGLTSGVINMLTHHGTEAQKQTFLPKLIAGTWAGTMNLTESHCGTDLGMLRTKAVKQDDGTYKITGTKIFISAGEHDLTENIIHTVLARVEGAPEGTKGISLFLVPKFLVNEDGSLGERNGVSCGSIEEKMGIHGNSTCVLNYDGATGHLVGEENRGLNQMFIMVNGARIGVGIQGMANAEVAYQNAVAYAKNRLQGRSVTGIKNEDGPADPIIVHPDVRRMLMDARAFLQGARAAYLWVSILADILRCSEDEAEREEAEDLLRLLTPVIKAHLSERGFQTANDMQQVFGGHGYIREWGMESYVRDARITMMYEGANGIQALDLVGRKLPKNNGRAIRRYFSLLEGFCDQHGDDQYEAFVTPLREALGRLQQGTMWLMQNGTANADEAAGASMPYLELLGHVMLAHMWAKMAITSTDAIARGSENIPFHEAKIITAGHYFARLLPKTLTHLKQIEAGAASLMALPQDAF